MFSFSKAPAIDRQRDQAFFGTDGRVSRLRLDAPQKLLLAEVIHAAMPVDVQQSWCGSLTLVRDQHERGNRLDAIQIEHQPFHCVALVLFGTQQSRQSWAVLPRKVAQQVPQLSSTFLLIGDK